MSTPAKTRKQTLADWLALPEDSRIELINGDLIEKAMPGYEHSDAQFGLNHNAGHLAR